MLQVSSLNQLIGQVPSLQVSQSYQPQQAAPVQQVQPQPQGAYGDFQRQQPGGLPVGQTYDLHSMANDYDQNQAINRDLNNISVNLPQGQPGGLPAYHDLSAQQHPANPISMQGATYHVPGQGIVMNAIHSLSNLIR